MKRTTLVMVCLALLVALSALAVAKKKTEKDIMDNPVPPGMEEPKVPPYMIPQGEDGTVCWSSVTDVKWHMEDGKPVVESQRVVGSGRILLPPGASEKEKKFRIDLMTDLAFALDESSTISTEAIGSRRVCWNCSGDGIRQYLGRWDAGLHWCLLCQGQTCTVKCKATSTSTCPPAC